MTENTLSERIQNLEEFLEECAINDIIEMEVSQVQS